MILRGRFKTNALVRLSGSLPSRRGVLCINAEQIELGNLREFAVARILCEAAKGATARGDPWFVQAQEIVARVQELLRNPKLESKWRYAGAEDVYRVVNSLRGKFKERDLNPLLIESGQRGQGYRLSTPPWNVELLCD